MLDDDFLIWSQRHQHLNGIAKILLGNRFKKLLTKTFLFDFDLNLKLNFEQKFIYIDLAWIRLTNTTR